MRGKEKDSTVWISESPLAGVGDGQGEVGIIESQVTCASCFKKFGEHCVAECLHPPFVKGASFCAMPKNQLQDLYIPPQDTKWKQNPNTGSSPRPLNQEQQHGLWTISLKVLALQKSCGVLLHSGPK